MGDSKVTPEQFEKGRDNFEISLCKECDLPLSAEDFDTRLESRGECHGAPSFESVDYGYVCSQCGHKEVY